jgi:hypothetical protein
MDERKAAANSAQAQPEKGMRLCAARYGQACTEIAQWLNNLKTNKK